MPDALERFRREVARVADTALSAARGEAELAAVAARVGRAAEDALARGRAPGMPPAACARGCATCCTINVATLAPEGAAAAAWLRARLGPEEAAALAGRLAAFHGRIRWLEDRERILGHELCPFLDAARACSIHPVRPLACRSVSSLDAEDCRRAMAGADDDEAPVVRMDLLQRALYAEAIASLADALARRGLDARCRDVSGMTAAFLSDASLSAAFLAGGRLPLE